MSKEIRAWNPDDISNKQWNKATLYTGLFNETSIEKTKRLFMQAKQESLRRLRQRSIWKRTRAHRTYGTSIAEVKQTYANAVMRFLQHPECSESVQTQNSLVGGFSMRSSLVSIGMIPDTKGKIFVHNKWKSRTGSS